MKETQAPVVKRGTQFQGGMITVLSICHEGVVIDHTRNPQPIMVSRGVIETLFEQENQ